MCLGLSIYRSMNMEPSPNAATASEDARAKLSDNSSIDLALSVEDLKVIQQVIY